MHPQPRAEAAPALAPRPSPSGQQAPPPRCGPQPGAGQVLRAPRAAPGSGRAAALPPSAPGAPVRSSRAPRRTVPGAAVPPRSSAHPAAPAATPPSRPVAVPGSRRPARCSSQTARTVCGPARCGRTPRSQRCPQPLRRCNRQPARPHLPFSQVSTNPSPCSVYVQCQMEYSPNKKYA